MAASYCSACKAEVGPGSLIYPENLGVHPKAYVIDPHVVERAKFIVKAHERATGCPVDWAFHLSFAWVARTVPGGSVRGFWQRQVCGPAILEPDFGWVTDSEGA